MKSAHVLTAARNVILNCVLHVMLGQQFYRRSSSPGYGTTKPSCAGVRLS